MHLWYNQGKYKCAFAFTITTSSYYYVNMLVYLHVAKVSGSSGLPR